MLLVQVQLAQLSPHGVMVAALDLGSSGRTGRKSSSLFVGTMLMWAQVAKGKDCKSYDIFPPGVRFPPSALMNLYGTVAQLVERKPEELRVGGSFPSGPTIWKCPIIGYWPSLERSVVG